MFDKVQKKKTQAEQEEAERRGKMLDAATMDVIDVAVKHDLSVNDFEVVLQQCLNGIKNVYLSHKVFEFTDAAQKPKEVAAEFTPGPVTTEPTPPVESTATETTPPVEEPTA